MAYEADRVVVELIAKNEQFDAATDASRANFQQSMAAVQSSGSGGEKAVQQFSSALKANRLEMNQSRIGMMEFQHIARGVSDQIAAGAPLTQVLTQHMGMLGEAVALSGGTFGKFGAFLMGPWGVALTLATVVGGKLLQHFLDEKDSLDSTYDALVKHKQQTELSAQAEDIWSHSLDGLIERTQKLTGELDKRLITQSKLNDATMQGAREEYAAALSAQARLEASGASPDQVAKASREVTAAAVALHEAEESAAETAAKASTDINDAAKTWIDAQRRMMEVIAGEHPELAGNEAIKQAVDLVDKAATDAAAAGMQFKPLTDQVHSLDTQLLNGSINADTFAQKMRALATSTEASVEAFKHQGDAITKFKQSVIGAEGTGANRLGSSAAGFGQFMPSTWESYFKQLYPQQSATMSNAAIDALRNNRQIATAVIDKATDDYVAVLKRAGQQISEASLYTVHLLGARDARKLLAAPAGEDTSAFLSGAVLRGNPFLRGSAGDARAAIAKRIGDSSGAVSSGAAALEQAQEQAIKKEQEQQAAFTSEMDRLNDELIKAREGQSKDALQQLDYQEDEVRAEQQRRDDGYDAAVTAGKLKQAAADELKEVNAKVTAEKLKNLETQKQIEIIQRQDEASERMAQYEEDDLRAAEQAATSQAQRREIDLQILDILYQEKLAHLESLKLIAEKNGDLKAQADLQAQIDQLPQQKANDTAGVLRQTMDPLEAWLQSVPHDAKAVEEALQGIATNGFDQIASSIAGVLTGTQSLGQAFSSLARQVVGDIIQMTVRMLIFRAISSFMGLGAGVPNLGSSNDLATALDPIANSITVPSLPTFAGGGFGVIGGRSGTDSNLLSLNGQPVAWVSQGEGLAITPNNASAASPLGGGQSFLLVKVEPNDDRFDAYVAGVAGPIAAQYSTNASFSGAAMARQSLARRQTHLLGSRG